jgi:hypothetical protein
MEQMPKVPECAEALASDVTQMHSSRYRNPQSLPEGAVHSRCRSARCSSWGARSRGRRSPRSFT